MDKRIINFIKEHHVLTLATSENNKPYCANAFYAYDEDNNLLIFNSDTKTKHVQDFLSNSQVAASIVLETKTVGKIQGAQICGTVLEPKDDLLKSVKKIYLKRFPYAVLTHTTLWVLDMAFVKMTDNRLGFGKKLIWEKQD